MGFSDSSPSDPENEADLSGRVAALERRVEKQQSTLAALEAEVQRLRSHLATAEGRDGRPGDDPRENAPSGSHAPVDGRNPEPPLASSDATSPSRSSPAAPRALLDRLGFRIGLSSEDWLNYVGIGLFLLGVAFLLRYSIEQGWLVPEIRIGFGAALGAGLLASGRSLPASRRRLRQVLLGGSSATFYATLFAAYQFYGLIAYPVAFAAMVGVTVATVVLAVRENEAILATIGVLGGLGTPFLLYTETGTLAGLSLYTCLVLAGACAVFLSRGWWSFLYTTVVAGWAVFFVTVVRTSLGSSPPPDAWALQFGIAGAWLLLAGAPVLRLVRRRRLPGHESADRTSAGDSDARSGYSLVPASPFAAFFCTRLLWAGSDLTWALAAGGVVAVYGGAYVALRRLSLPDYASVHAVVAAVGAAYGGSQVLGTSGLLVAWSVEAGLLLVLAGRLDAPLFRYAGHGLFALVGAVFVGRLSEGSAASPPLVHPSALSELSVLAMGAAASRVARRRWLRWGYRGAVLVGWLAWTAVQLAPVSTGEAYTSVLWGATAAALLVAGARRDRRPWHLGGLAALAAFLAKLFLVDLASLPPLWRIALFLGFGGAFLGLSSLLPGLFPASTDERKGTAEG